MHLWQQKLELRQKGDEGNCWGEDGDRRRMAIGGENAAMLEYGNRIPNYRSLNQEIATTADRKRAMQLFDR